VIFWPAFKRGVEQCFNPLEVSCVHAGRPHARSSARRMPSRCSLSRRVAWNCRAPRSTTSAFQPVPQRDGQ
jgi:hypothetical protein